MATRLRQVGIGIGLIVLGVILSDAFTSSSLAQATANGRYQIVMNPQVRADTFLLDTTTGRMWMPTKYSDYEGEPVVWEVQTKIDSFAEFVAWSKTQKLKKSN
jgi:hypothetical protein